MGYSPEGSQRVGHDWSDLACLRKIHSSVNYDFPNGSVVKILPAMQEIQIRVWSLVGKMPWRRNWPPAPVFFPELPWTEEPGRLQPIGWQRVGHDWAGTQWVLVIFIMLHITSLGLIYLITGSFYLFLSFKSFSLTVPPLVTTNLISCLKCNFFFYSFWSVIDLQCHVSFWCLAWRHFSLYFKTIIMISLVLICHNTKILYS